MELSIYQFASTLMNGEKNLTIKIYLSSNNPDNIVIDGVKTVLGRKRTREDGEGFDFYKKKRRKGDNEI